MQAPVNEQQFLRMKRFTNWAQLAPPSQSQRLQCLQTAVSHKSRSGCNSYSGAFTENTVLLQRPEPKHPSRDRRQHTTSQTTSHAPIQPNCLQQATTAGISSLPASTVLALQTMSTAQNAAQCKWQAACEDVQKAHCDQKQLVVLGLRVKRKGKKKKPNKTSMHIQTSHGRAKSVSLQYKNFVNRNIVKDRPLLARFVLVLLCAPPPSGCRPKPEST